MSRPLRIEFPGATYHVTARGDRREPIFVDEHDRAQFLSVLSQGLARFGARLLAYCLMGNHYHLVLLTPQANLSLLMRHVNGVYTQAFNRRHGVVGHLFQGRFKGILVDTDSYLMALCRYVELNPVRAKLIDDAAAWPWSSYLAHTGQAPPLEGLDVRVLHDFMLGRACTTPEDHAQAAQAYAQAVAQGAGEGIWAEGLRQQIYLGDADFVHRMQALADERRQAAREVPSTQRARPLGMQDWLARGPTREAALVAAHRQSGLSMTEMALALGLSVSRVSRLISQRRLGNAGVMRGERVGVRKKQDLTLVTLDPSHPDPSHLQSPLIRCGDVDTVLVHVQPDVQGARFVHGPSPGKFATTRPPRGPVRGCSSARFRGQSTVLLGDGPPQ